MAGRDNLIPNSQRSPEELREMTRRGGIKSGEVRRRKRDSQKQMLELLKCMPELDDRTVEKLTKMGFKGKGKDRDKFTLETIAYGALLKKAMNGDVGANRLILEIIGEDAQTKRMRAQMEHEKEITAMMTEAAREDDGFMDALKDTLTEVFAGGTDEPRNTEDSLE